MSRISNEMISHSLDHVVERLSTVLQPDRGVEMLRDLKLWNERHLKKTTPFYWLFDSFECWDRRYQLMIKWHEKAMDLRKERYVLKQHLAKSELARKSFADLIRDGIANHYGDEENWDWVARQILGIYSPETYRELEKEEMR